jgi:hypothetical protein
VKAVIHLKEIEQLQMLGLLNAQAMVDGNFIMKIILFLMKSVLGLRHHI